MSDFDDIQCEELEGPSSEDLAALAAILAEDI